MSQLQTVAGSPCTPYAPTAVSGTGNDRVHLPARHPDPSRTWLPYGARTLERAEAPLKAAPARFPPRGGKGGSAAGLTPCVTEAFAAPGYEPKARSRPDWTTLLDPGAIKAQIPTPHKTARL